MTNLALLKGINVGSKNRINMIELKSILIEHGFEHVMTYINTGNVILKSNQTPEQLSVDLEALIQSELNLEIPVISRCLIDLEKLVHSCPYDDEHIKSISEGKEYECFYVAFLSCKPSKEQIKKFDTYKTVQEDYVIIDDNIYLLLECSIRESKLARQLIKLDKKSLYEIGIQF